MFLTIFVQRKKHVYIKAGPREEGFKGFVSNTESLGKPLTKDSR